MVKNVLEDNYTLMRVALGEEKADTVLVGGNYINVHTLEIYPADIAIKNGKIVFIGDVSHTVGDKTEKVDVNGCYLAPGFIDAHFHNGGTNLNMTEFGKLALVHGTTAMATDMYEVGIVLGLKGIRFFVDELKSTGLKTLFVIPMPAYHQNEEFENLGTFTEKDAMEALNWPDCYGINELNMIKIIKGDKGVARLVLEAHRLGKSIIGHASELRGKELQGVMNFVNVTSDHECTNWEDANEKARLGMNIQVREGSIASDIKAVIGTKPDELNLIGDFCFSTDELDPGMMNSSGHIDFKIKMSIALGVQPALAIRAASLNAARFFRLDDKVGSLTPGKSADIVVLDNLEDLNVKMVFVDGEKVAQDKKYIKPISQPKYPKFLIDTVHLKKISSDTFQVKAPGDGPVEVRVIGLEDGSVFSKPLKAVLKPKNGLIEADQENDILKIAVFDRHQRSGRKGIGFINGLNIKNGAIGSTYNPCGENLMVLGSNDNDMAVAANYLIEKNGGFVAVRDGKVLKAMDLPIAGMFAIDSYEKAAKVLDELHKEVAEMGCKIESPFHQVAFMVYPGHFPSYKLTTYGLVDYYKGKVVSIFI
jgi:adenine deaminase